MRQPISSRQPGRVFWVLGLLAAILASAVLLPAGPVQALDFSGSASPYAYLPLVMKPGESFVMVGWNDLGMHCYNRDFSSLGVLPPFNNLYAQVIKRGNPPELVNQQITLSYTFPQNTYSVGKSNFWTYAQDLFNLSQPLADNVGLTGKTLAGTLDWDTARTAFVAEGIPLTEYNDADWNNRQPYQLAELTARNAATNAVLASLTVVAPVSTEMRCDICHSDNGRGNEDFATGKVETNILSKHDAENSSDYPPGEYGSSLMANQPVLCADCHASNALGKPGVNGLPNFSNAMHGKHAEIDAPQPTCYDCHPGPQTQCLRDVMSQQFGMTCTSCHGSLAEVAQNPNPWLNEPRCDTCHAGYDQNNALYRLSTGHAGLYCEACHDSTHAIAPSSQANDAIKFGQLQGASGPLSTCTVCHTTPPTGSVH